MSEEKASVITDEMRSLIGAESEPFTAWDSVESGAVRRFCQAIMDADPVYWDESFASQTKYGGVVAPPLYPSFTSRRPPGTPDPLDRFKDDPDWDGLTGSGGRREPGSLPPIDLPLNRTLNGGVAAEFFALCKPGDRITGTRRYIDISERTGRSGLMVLIVTETTYTNQDGVLLCKVQNTSIRR